jgi:hypothetical protein
MILARIDSMIQSLGITKHQQAYRTRERGDG